jgi:hypothetical protein
LHSFGELMRKFPVCRDQLLNEQRLNKAFPPDRAFESLLHAATTPSDNILKAVAHLFEAAQEMGGHRADRMNGGRLDAEASPFRG